MTRSAPCQSFVNKSRSMPAIVPRRKQCGKARRARPKTAGAHVTANHLRGHPRTYAGAMPLQRLIGNVNPFSPGLVQDFDNAVLRSARPFGGEYLQHNIFASAVAPCKVQLSARGRAPFVK